MSRVSGITRTTLLFILAGALAASSFVGAAMAQTPTPSQGKTVFTIGSPDDVDSMNQFNMVSYGYTIHSMSYDLLLGFSDKDLSPVPDVATEVPTQDNGGISSDGLTWTFHIRSGMKWSDGVPLTAHDVAYTFNRVIDEHQGCCFSYLKLVKSVTAPDDTTLIIKATAPTTSLTSIYIYIYPEHIWSKISTDEAKTEENFPGVTSGPFHPVQWEKGQFMTLEANPDYYAGAPKVDQIVWRVFNNEDAEIQALKNGEIDFVNDIKPNLYNSLKSDPSVTTHPAVINALDDIAMNTGDTQGDGNPALRDPLFRRALSMAIDRQTLIDKVKLGYASPGTTIVTPFTATYHATVPPDKLIPFDIPGANQLLDQGGYTDTDNNGIRNMPNGGPDIELRYYLASSVDGTTATAQFVQNWLKQIGIATTVKAFSDNKLTDIEQAGTYDIVHWDWFPDPDPDFILSVLTCAQRPHLNADGQNVGGIWSDTYYCNKQYDKWYAQQKAVTSVPDRAAIVKDMQLQVYDAAPYVILWYANDLQAYRSNWTGFTPQPSPNGDLEASYGNTTWISIHPVAGSSGETPTKGIPAGVWFGIVAAIAVVIIAIVVVRRRKPDEDTA